MNLAPEAPVSGPAAFRVVSPATRAPARLRLLSWGLAEPETSRGLSDPVWFLAGPQPTPAQ